MKTLLYALLLSVSIFPASSGAQQAPHMHKAAFFDRDGTLIKAVDYLSKIEDVEILPGTVDVCLNLKKQGYLFFMVTNQSGIARGYFDEQFVKKTNEYVCTLFAQHDIHFTQCYYCPHHPSAAIHEQYKKECSCRKPKPGMLLAAAQEFSVDLPQSLMFGDSQSDLEAGSQAGCQSFDIQTFIKNQGRGI